MFGIAIGYESVLQPVCKLKKLTRILSMDQSTTTSTIADMTKPELVILRGIPGSGKMTYAQTHFPNHVILNNDRDYHMVFGFYMWTPCIAIEAYEGTFNKAKDMIEQGKDVVIANTNTDPQYVQSLCNLPARIRIIRLNSYYKCIHPVPLSRIERLAFMMLPVKGEEFVNNTINRSEHIVLPDSESVLLTLKQQINYIPYIPDLMTRIYTRKIMGLRGNPVHGVVSREMHDVLLATILTSCIPPLRDEWGDVLISKDNATCDTYKGHVFIVSSQELMLAEHYHEPRVLLDFSKDTEWFMHYQYFRMVLSWSLKIYPRRYMFESIHNKNKPMGGNGFAELVSKIYEKRGVKWSIIQARKSYAKHYIKPMRHTCYVMSELAKYMRASFEGVIGYAD